MPEEKSHIRSFSSDMLPERDRFEAFREEIARKLSRVDVVKRSDVPFYAHLRTVTLGPSHLVEIRSSPAAYVRTADLTSDGNDDFVFMMSGRSTFYSRQADRVLAEGDGALGDRSRPGSTINDHAATGLAFTFPRQQLLGLVPRVEDVAKLPTVRADQAEMKLILHYVGVLLETPTLESRILEIVSTHVCDLIALALGASGDSHHLATERGLRSARSLAIRHETIGRMREPALSAADVARSHGVSERYLRELFAEIGTSFSDFLIEQRLTLARRLLASPLSRNRQVADIAREVGFSDVSHFNRRFRARFGDTPTAFRDRRDNG